MFLFVLIRRYEVYLVVRVYQVYVPVKDSIPDVCC